MDRLPDYRGSRRPIAWFERLAILAPKALPGLQF
jgi:hypothetical protein